MLSTIFGILLTLQVILAIALAAIVLLQRSEGGVLGMGGNTVGFLTTRGTGDLLTKTTWVLATLLFLNVLGLIVVGNLKTKTASVVDRAAQELKLDKSQVPAPKPNTELPAPSTDQAPATQTAPAQPGLDSLSNLKAAPAQAPAPAKPVDTSKSSGTSAPTGAPAKK